MRPGRTVGGIDLDLLAGFRIFQSDDADVRQLFLALILNVDGDEIMPPAGDRKFARKIAASENPK